MTKAEFESIKAHLLAGKPFEGEALDEILISLGKMGKNMEVLQKILKEDPKLFREILMRMSKNTVKNLGEAALTVANI